jgi:hypothetical protein
MLPFLLLIYWDNVIEWIGFDCLCLCLVAEFCPGGMIDLVLLVELEWSCQGTIL